MTGGLCIAGCRAHPPNTPAYSPTRTHEDRENKKKTIKNKHAKSKHRLPLRGHRLTLPWFRGGVAPVVTRKSQRHQLIPVCHGQGRSSRFRSSWSISVTALEVSPTVGAPRVYRPGRPVLARSHSSRCLGWWANEYTTMCVHLLTSADDGAVRRTVTRAAGIGLPISYRGVLILRHPWPCRQTPR